MVIIGASNGDLAASPASVMKYVFGVVDPLVLKCAIKLDILDVIYQAPQPVTLAELAASLPVQCADLSKLCRLLHYLACMDVVVLCCDGVAESYALTPSAKFLVKGEGTTLASFLLLIHDENFLSAVHGLDAVLVGEKPAISTYKKVKSETLNGHFAGNPELSQVFNQAMVEKGLIGIATAMEVCPELFLGIESLVDVGGGVGVLAHEIVKKFPRINCTVLDLQHVIECSSEYPGITYLAGNMFEHIPKSDAILLMSVLQTWSDEESLQILKRCKEALTKKKGKLIIIDAVLEREEDKEEADAEEVELRKARLAVDMLLLAICKGRARTEKDWRELLLKAGFNVCKITNTKTLQHVIEAYPC